MIDMADFNSINNRMWSFKLYIFQNHVAFNNFFCLLDRCVNLYIRRILFWLSQQLVYNALAFFYQFRQHNGACFESSDIGFTNCQKFFKFLNVIDKQRRARIVCLDFFHSTAERLSSNFWYFHLLAGLFVFFFYVSRQSACLFCNDSENFFFNLSLHAIDRFLNTSF